VSTPRFDIGDGAQLRRLVEADGAELYGLIEDNRGFLAEWMPWAADQTLERTLNFIRAAEQRAEDDNGFETALVVDGRIAGALGLVRVDGFARATSMGYWLGERYQGRGLMTRGVAALVDHAFGAMGLHRVEIQAAIENRRSRAIPERLGFEQEGVLREAERVRDRYHDLAVYGLLAPAWPGAASALPGPATAS
jgi:ribosomal-protein-serine acetyltransferase